MYSLSSLLVILIFYFFSKQSWALFSLFFVFLAAVDYLPLLIIFPLFLYGFQKLKTPSEFKKFILSLIPTFLFLFFWFPTFRSQFVSTATYLYQNLWWKEVLGKPSLKELALVWVKFLVGRVSFENKLFYLILVFLISLPFLFVLWKSFTQKEKSILFWLWFILPPILFFFISFFTGGFSYFRLLFILPSFYILLSLGVEKIKLENFWFLVLVSLNFALASLYLSNSAFWREDWRGLVNFVEARIKNEEKILISYPRIFAGYEWYAKFPQNVLSFSDFKFEEGLNSLYSLDYLMDLTDPERKNYFELQKKGFKNTQTFNFRGVGQLRYWVKE